jgi:hypothetical protein
MGLLERIILRYRYPRKKRVRKWFYEESKKYLE